MHVAQALAKTRQAIQRSLPRIVRQIAPCREALGQANGLPDTINDGELAMAQLTNDHMKTGRAEVDGRNNLWLC
jgi:hypothetical protein